MATTEELKLKVSADVAGAVSGLKQLDTGVSKLGNNIETIQAKALARKSFLSTETDIKKIAVLNREIAGLESELTRVKNIGKAGFDEFGNAATAGTNVVAKGASKAFGALRGMALVLPGIGVAGILGFVAEAVIGLTGLNDKADKTKNTFAGIKKTLEEYVEALDTLNQARVKGNQGAQEELVHLKTLYDATQNQNISIAKRKQLVDELQDQYPKYFANISDETILAGGAQKAYERLSAAILASAKARAAQDIIVDIQKQVIALESKITDNMWDQVAAQQAMTKARQRAKDAAGSTPEFVEGTSNEAAAAIGKANDKTKEGNALIAQKNDLLKQAESLTKNITAITVDNPDALLKPTGDVKKVKQKILKDIDDIRATFTGFIGRDNPIPIFYELQLAKARAKNEPSETAAQQLTKELLPKTIPLRVNIAPTLKIVNPDELISNLQKQLQDAVKGAAISGFTGIGESIGAAIASGADPIKAAFDSIGGTIADLITQIGKALIEYGVVKEALDKILQGGIIIPGVAALAAGVAAVAIGTLLKSSFKPKGYATGGVIPPGFPNDSYYARLTSGERVLTPSQNKDWEKRKVGPANVGSGTQVFIPSVDVDYSKLRLIFNRMITNGGLTS